MKPENPTPSPPPRETYVLKRQLVNFDRRSIKSKSPYIRKLKRAFRDNLHEHVVMGYYTTSRVGGAADVVLIVHSMQELIDAASRLWDMDIPFYVLGNGSNILISDAGVREVIVINRSHTIKITTCKDPPTALAETGANMTTLARQAALRGMSGLEWAAHIPGSVGGAIYGNAGIPNGGTQSSLLLADILHRDKGRVSWPCNEFAYSYRSSSLKREQKAAANQQMNGGKRENLIEFDLKQPDSVVILAGIMNLEPSSVSKVKARMNEMNKHRRQNQPPGACMGSTFKNPPGDYAGRLLEQAGIKGTSIGGVQSSPVHANFFINNGNASAQDYWNLISLARNKVFDKFGIWLELEIELLGDWKA